MSKSIFTVGENQLPPKQAFSTANKLFEWCQRLEKMDYCESLKIKFDNYSIVKVYDTTANSYKECVRELKALDNSGYHAHITYIETSGIQCYWQINQVELNPNY